MYQKDKSESYLMNNCLSGTMSLGANLLSIFVPSYFLTVTKNSLYVLMWMYNEFLFFYEKEPYKQFIWRYMGQTIQIIQHNHFFVKYQRKSKIFIEKQPKRCRIHRNATPFWLFFDKNFAFSLVSYEKMIMLNLNHFVLHM